MADASTALYALVKPEVGASADTWGGKLNANADDLDTLTGAKATTGSANAYVLTTGLSLAAYVTGQRFTLLPNFTNSGAATLNVDGLGAKNIYKNASGVVGAVASGDIVSGIPIDAVYDGTQFVVRPTRELQPIDATLTALAALSWSSGNALVQFTAADTVSLTLTPSVSSITASQGAANTTPSGTFVNTTDNASVRALRIEGDRATPTPNDAVFTSFYLSNGSGTQTEIGRITTTETTITAASEQSTMGFGIIASGTLATYAVLAALSFRPNTNDLIGLGTATVSWSDLFLASGGVINWNNGNFTLTHSSGALEASGTLRFRSPLSSETSGTLTSASANKRVKATAGVTINDGVFTAEDCVEIYNDSDSSITLTQDTGMTLRLAGSTSTGNRTLAARAIAYVYFDTNADAAVAGTGVT